MFLGISLPSYLVALFAIFIFAVTIHNVTGFLLFPAGGDRDINSTIPDWLDQLWHLILPASVLSFLLTATFMRYTRASVIEVMGQDYVVAARSKGLSERTVRLDHVLRSALIPIVTVTALTLPALVTGAFFVETLFAWPGIGLLGVQSIQTHQYNIIMGVAMLTAVAIVISNLLADVLYAFVDPRIRYS